MSENKDPIQAFIDHVEQKDQFEDATASKSEDRFYYELDASIVDAVVQVLKDGDMSDVVWGVPWIESDFGQKSQGWRLYSTKRDAWKDTLEQSKAGPYSGGYYGPVRPLMVYMIPRNTLEKHLLEALQMKGQVHTHDMWEPKYKKENGIVSG